MLPGVARKIAIPFILLSVAGLVLFGVGFGIRNFRYKEQSDQTIPPFSLLDHAAKPEFFLFWAFAAGAVLVYVLSFMHTFLENKVVKLLLNIFLPVFLLGGGGVLLANGLAIYHYYQAQNNAAILFYCTDIYRSVSSALSALTGFQPPDIHGAENYVSIEFAGVIVALGFYWIFMMISSFFISAKKVYA